MINLQIESRHKEFFGVLVLHDYYNDLVCRDLVMEPTPETAELFRNYKLVFKPADFGFVVLYTPEASEDSLRKIPPKTRFSFFIRNRNPNFMNFTKVKFWPEGVVFHYSNAKGAEEDLTFKAPKDVYYYFKGLKVADVKKKLLHLPEQEYLSRRPPRFNVALGSNGKDDKGVSYDSIVIEDEMGDSGIAPGSNYKRRYRDAQRDLFRRHLDHLTRPLAREELTPSVKEKRIIEIADQLEKELSGSKSIDQVVDLRHAPLGRYTLKMGDLAPFDVYTSETPDAQAFGILDIHVDTAQNALLNRKAEKDEDVIQPQLFHIHFQTRATYWRYIFLNYENSKVTPKHIRDENSVIEFTDPVESMLELIGAPMVYCQSTEPVKLQDKANEVLFVARMNGKRPMKELRLPTPSGNDLVRPERTGGVEKIYSNVYVYL